MCKYLATNQALHGLTAKRRLIGSCLSDDLAGKNDANGVDVTLYIVGRRCSYVHHPYWVKAKLTGQPGLDNSMSCPGINHCGCFHGPGDRLPLFLEFPLQGA